MRILVISDIHGNKKNLDYMIEYFNSNPFDYFIILGDIFQGNTKEMAHSLSRVVTNLILIKGNCDSILDDNYSPVGLRENFSLMLNNRHLYFTHGHKYFPFGILKEGDIYCHGHTHISIIQKSDLGYIECNPGSLSLPRGNTTQSYMIIDQSGIKIYDLEHRLIKEMSF